MFNFNFLLFFTFFLKLEAKKNCTSVRCTNTMSPFNSHLLTDHVRDEGQTGSCL